MSAATACRLIVNADDFGRSHAINQAVILAHREGILTSASLMVNEPGFAEAAELARQNPGLAVGLHLTLIQGHATLPSERIPGLVNHDGEFGRNPTGLGWRYFVNSGLREPLRREIEAQFNKFRQTGLHLDHVNGHLHLHQQPVVFRLLMENAAEWGVTHFRLLREPLRPNLRVARGRYFTRALHAGIFAALSLGQGCRLRARGIKHAHRVFGQLQNGRIDEEYVLRLLPHLPPGDSELYSHPSLDEFNPELDALVSPRVQAEVVRLGIRLIGYRDL